MNYIEKIKDTFNLMGVKNALIIDDDLNIADSIKEKVFDILDEKFDDEEFSIQGELEELGLQKEEVLSQLDEDHYPPELLKKLEDKFPDFFKSKIDNLISLLKEIFDGEIILKNKASHDDELSSISEETVIFLDYHLVGSPLESRELTKLFSKQDLVNPLLIVFISSNEEFYLEDQSYKMEVLADRNKYFRGLRTQQLTSDYKNSLYEYINKGKINSEETLLKSLYEVSQNLYGGQQFFKLLSQIEEVLMESSREVLGKFHLLNSRSLQELLIEKVALEGESESTFLLNWISRNISKSVTKVNALTYNIHNTLEEIGEWSIPFNELHEDVALKEIVRDEMWDLKINERYAPIDFGDVFEINYNGKIHKAILVTQPCTLGVRGNGKRAGNLATLVLEEKTRTRGESLAIIEDWNGDKLIFDLNTTINIPFEVLDMTTLDENGHSKILFEENNEGKNVKLPENVLWSKGYTKMITSITKKLLSELSETKELFHFGYMWVPFVKKDNVYEFPIKRKTRLDTFYTLYVHQKLQSWSGRIGLPLDVKFMSDYVKKTGDLNINGIPNKVELYVKQTNTEVKDIAISLDTLQDKLFSIYKENTSFCERLKEVFKSPDLLKYNYSSGERLVSLDKYSEAISILSKQNIYINLQKSELSVNITVGEFTKCLFNGTDSSSLFSDFGIDSGGQIKYQLQTKLLEDLEITKSIHNYENRIIDIGGGNKVIKLNTKFNLFEHNIHGDVLEIRYSGEVAATV